MKIDDQFRIDVRQGEQDRFVSVDCVMPNQMLNVFSVKARDTQDALFQIGMQFLHRSGKLEYTFVNICESSITAKTKIP